MAAAAPTARVVVRADADPTRSPHAQVEAGEGWTRAALFCGSAGDWAPAAQAAARLLQGLLGGELPAAVLDFPPGGSVAAREALTAALATLGPPPSPSPAALPPAFLGPLPSDERGRAGEICERVRDHARQHGAHPSFTAADARTRARVENYVVSVHGGPLAPPLLAEVCGLLARAPGAP